MGGLCCFFLYHMCHMLQVIQFYSPHPNPFKTYVTYLRARGFLYHFKHKIQHNFSYFAGHTKCSYEVSPAALAKFTPPTPQMPRMSLAAPECQRCRRGLKGRRTKAVRASVHQKYGRSEMATNIGTWPLPHCSSLMSGPISAIKGDRAPHRVK